MYNSSKRLREAADKKLGMFIKILEIQHHLFDISRGLLGNYLMTKNKQH